MKYRFLSAILVPLAVFPPHRAAAGDAFATLEAEARALVAKPFVAETDKVPPYFAKLDYDAFRHIRFRPEKALWAGDDVPFRAELFHCGLFFDHVVGIATADDSGVRPVPYDPSRFDFGASAPPPGTTPPAGYAGFRWHAPSSRGGWDEFAVFAGASYFRCRPSGGADYGASGRAVAVDTGIRDVPEVFPYFKRWILSAPRKGSATATACGLLEGPKLTGVFRFDTSPGRIARTHVTAVLFFREKVARLGLAPFSSMYWHGENSLRRAADFRPEVHDSDGLAIGLSDGRRIWRPLANDGYVRHSVVDAGPVSDFGLRQRDTEYASYKDIGARYHARPGVRVTPGKGWPAGALHLLELPTGEEYWDNVVAYWQPAKSPEPGDTLRFEYDVEWAMEPEFEIPAGPARVVETLVSPKEKSPGVMRFVVDWDPVPGDRRGRPDVFPRLVATAKAGAVLRGAELHYNAETGGWRAVIDVSPPPAASDAALQAHLERDGRPVTECWLYRPEASGR